MCNKAAGAGTHGCGFGVESFEFSVEISLGIFNRMSLVGGFRVSRLADAGGGAPSKSAASTASVAQREARDMVARGVRGWEELAGGR
jgi:hypothetical protein